MALREERRGALALLTLDREKELNALDRSLLGAIRDAALRLSEDASLRAVVLTGAGRAFAAGADIQSMRDMTPREAEAFSRLGHEATAALESLPVPTIAAVNGFALGGGCEIACACDWIYASSKARFGQPEVNLGLIPGFGGTSRLPRRVGIAWAKEIVLSGELLSADDALRIGLVNRVFAPDELLPAAIAMGETIAKRGPLAVSLGKRVLQEGQDADIRLAHAYEQTSFSALFSSRDRSEGLAAFVEKRDPSFKNE